MLRSDAQKFRTVMEWGLGALLISRITPETIQPALSGKQVFLTEWVTGHRRIVDALEMHSVPKLLKEFQRYTDSYLRIGSAK